MKPKYATVVCCHCQRYLGAKLSQEKGTIYDICLLCWRIYHGLAQYPDFEGRKLFVEHTSCVDAFAHTSLNVVKIYLAYKE